MLKNILLDSTASNTNTATTIDIGDASTQITFAADEISNEKQEEYFTLKIPKWENQQFNFTLKTASQLLGQDVSRQEILDSEVKDGASFTACFNAGYNKFDAIINRNIIGQGKPEECINQIRNLFQISNCKFPEQQECNTKSIFVKGPQRKLHMQSVLLYIPEFNAHELRRAAIEFCKYNFQDIMAKEPKNKYIDNKCYQGLYVSTLLIDGYGVGNMVLQAPQAIQSQEPTWALGFLLFKLWQKQCNFN
ncbi:hypothetical protein IMG5_101280 [Ichthyophthirius multifiliis]|uniref:Uncharacterized protein n=1 Tax=Ichthyophthirius multifiliis TaxID=5932 RepID=G0QSI6_ICHMU|nr:hypothetical protein IMG5_101280 [Ichthyophthirius multifiliis]EGR31824.1 hypothetical protein IMG5_101280 [Ichthyophthirius multifiliis]|eukprot:XP_004035310.1 hypothetical protein IMG5_101280 [Ichthyophthirius multifiliis]